ncbi:MAG: hypothetical protein M1324_01895 [Patescibacteria group bacterium]|nr:hypothetical protein [Patescibacteria group bacterium]
MNIEDFDIKDKLAFLQAVEYKFAIRYFRFYISLIYQILESVCGAMVYYPDGALNYAYANLKLGLDNFLSREDLKELAKDCPQLPESLFGDVLEYECYWETEQTNLLSFLGLVEKEFIINGYTVGILPEEQQIADSIQELCYEHSKICKQGFAKMEENIDKTMQEREKRMKPKKISLYNFQIEYNNDSAEVIIGKTKCAMPLHKNNHCLCRMMFNQPIGKAICWDEIYTEMFGNSEPAKNQWRRVYDSMNDINNQIKKKLNTNDELFSWRSKSVIRNF